MNDLISRLSEIRSNYNCFNENEEPYYRALSEAIQLASAQPDIIKCKDCKHYNAGFECLIEGYGIERSADWYCGDAERRTDELD